jgi:hypothetical protein
MIANDMPRGVADYPTAFTAFHQAYAARKGAVIWGDKSPNYYDCLPALARLFLKRGSSFNGEIPRRQRMPLRALPNPATLTSNSGELICEG